jgi:replication factor C large subunit
MELWIDKYKPSKFEEIISQNKAISEALKFLKSWKPGRALLFYGPPGVGKTLLAEVLASEKKWFLVSMNASDKRNAEAIEKTLAEASRSKSLFFSGKLILIDEVDGISPGDRGGLQAIVKIIKESRFPVILTANDAYLPKLQTLRNYCILIKFSRVNSRSIEKRLREICSKEGIQASDAAIKNLARWSSGDLRSAITDLQTVCQDKKAIGDKDLEVLGYRERTTNIFNILPTIFRSKNLNAARKVIQECDKDPDDIFWWIENNLHLEFTNPKDLANAFDMLSKADMYRQKVIVQQNWRFKAYMIDMMAGVSLAGEPSHRFIPYKPPDKLIRMGQTKHRRATLDVIYERIGAYTHCSKNVVKSGYIPYIKIILKRMKKAKAKEKFEERGLEFSEDDIKMIVSG